MDGWCVMTLDSCVTVWFCDKIFPPPPFALLQFMAVASVQDLSLGERTRHFVLDDDQHSLLTILLIGRTLATRGWEDHADRRLLKASWK